MQITSNEKSKSHQDVFGPIMLKRKTLLIKFNLIVSLIILINQEYCKHSWCFFSSVSN